ncbi:hypothetical protein PR003_g20421 [Phytophthora rubi]|uniref:Uncharacterized protein n=1 Tax=Phytophthora rubi TaxID=129364 RepID=A0A6A4DYW3_9STRA|nr:hypothetical protein PR003_g20421 [Phytophthora rubi]
MRPLLAATGFVFRLVGHSAIRAVQITFHHRLCLGRGYVGHDEGPIHCEPGQ